MKKCVGPARVSRYFWRVSNEYYITFLYLECKQEEVIIILSMIIFRTGTTNPLKHQ